MPNKSQLTSLTLSPIASFTFPFTNPNARSIAELSLAIQPFAALYKSREITPEQITEVDSLLDQIKKKRLYNFIMAVNALLKPLNTQIDAYNHADTIEKKVKHLRDIMTQKNEIDAQFPENAIKLCPEYIHAFYEKMTTEIQSQYQQLEKHRAVLSSHRYPLSQLLQTMPPAKLNHLLQILCDRKHYDDDLEELYAEMEEGYYEFNQFLKTHAISFIQGGNNATNLLIESTQNPSISYVLKIENRLNQPQNISQHFAKTVLKEVIPQPDMSRRAWFTRRHRDNQDEVIIRIIKTLPYYTMGNVHQHAFTQSRPVQRIRSALDIYRQMGTILVDLSHNGGAFPDMKNNNWLIGENQALQIADDKSLRWQNSDGILDVFSDRSQWYGDILKSLDYMPPEVFQATHPIVVDTLHVFTWGKNLYEYLVASQDKFKTNNTYLKLKNGADFNFDDFSVFNTVPTGPLLRQLIIDAVKPQANQRISMETALERLSQIQQLDNLHQSLLEILYSSHFAPDIIGKYIQGAFSSADPTALTCYTQEANRLALLNSVETFQTVLKKQYDLEWQAIFEKIDTILKSHPHEEIQAYYDQCLEDYKHLKPYAFEQFADDLSNLYEAAQTLEKGSRIPPNKA